ncbi:MAG: 2-hydroxyacid dehydrogenase [Phycisphaerae bacterium]|nr:2-hydroxyacid dehydrogenase [Phycisphaerae bacterium]
MTKKIAVFDTKKYDREFFERINSGYGYKIKFFEHKLNADTAKLAAGYDVVCVFVNDTIDETTIDVLHTNNVKLIAMRCAGYNNVDLKAAYGKIHVVRVPAYSPYAVAEHSVALIMSLNRKTHRAFYRTRDSNFAINGFLGFDMHGKTAGVIGTGKIGRCLVDILLGFGMEVLVYDKFPDEKLSCRNGVKYVPLQELYQKSDIISLHCPLNAETEYLINNDSIAQMKPGVMIINTGRGKLIDTQALIDGLKKGQVGSAGLDVYEEESEYFFEDLSNIVLTDDILARLLSFSNVLVTSHQGYFTAEAMENIARTTFTNINSFFNDYLMTNEVCYRCDREECNRKNGKNCF